MNALETQQVVAAVEAATRAPSILNCQPWRFRVSADSVEVFAVPERAPSFVDPTGRETLISVGAALLNLQLALLAAGRSPHVQLVPDPEDLTHAATVILAGAAELSEFERPLYKAIATRRCSRQPFTSELVRTEEFLRLQDAAVTEGGWLDPATGLHRVHVVDVLHDADRAQRDEPRIVDDVRRLTVERANPHLGIPVESLGPRPYNSAGTVRDLALGALSERPSSNFESDALLAVLLTTGDHPIDWLRAGLALERVLLAAEGMGLASGVLSHGTEVADLRPLVRDPSSRWRFPQVILRFGHAAPMPSTPRLPLDEVLELC
jgi:nitroreductase